jgi:pantetheine-phosphate adenylyltransferase
MTVVFSGSFDPITLGHSNIIERCSKLFDKVIILLADNPNKKYLFSTAEKIALIEKSVEAKNIQIDVCNTLITDYMHKNNLNLIVRGVRNSTDYDFENDLALMNKHIGEIETIFMPCEMQFYLTRSSYIKELARLGGEVSSFVSSAVGEALKEKFKVVT